MRQPTLFEVIQPQNINDLLSVDWYWKQPGKLSSFEVAFTYCLPSLQKPNRHSSEKITFSQSSFVQLSRSLHQLVRIWRWVTDSRIFFFATKDFILCFCKILLTVVRDIGVALPMLNFLVSVANESFLFSFTNLTRQRWSRALNFKVRPLQDLFFIDLYCWNFFQMLLAVLRLICNCWQRHLYEKFASLNATTCAFFSSVRQGMKELKQLKMRTNENEWTLVTNINTRIPTHIISLFQWRPL